MRKSENNPLTNDEMQEIERKKLKNKVHKNKRIDLAITKQIQDDLRNPPPKIRIDDVNALRYKSLQYFESCDAIGTLPSMLGLARSLGHSRSNLYYYIDKHPNTPSTEFLEIVRDSISEMLDYASLTRKVDNSTAIFMQKSIHQRIDKAELLVHTTNQTNNILVSPESIEEIQKKYLMFAPEPDTDI